MAGIPAYLPDHALRIAAFSLDAVRAANSVAWDEDNPSMGTISIRARPRATAPPRHRAAPRPDALRGAAAAPYRSTGGSTWLGSGCSRRGRPADRHACPWQHAREGGQEGGHQRPRARAFERRQARGAGRAAPPGRPPSR